MNIVFYFPQIFAGDECITFHSRQKRMCLPVTPWIFTQSTMPENGLERTIRVFWRSTIKYLKLPPNPRAGQRLIEFCQENALVIANTLFWKHQRRLYTWTSWDGQQWNQIGYILCSQRWRSSIQSAKTRPGADCCSEHELLTAKFRLKLKKIGKANRPFRYDLNQIPCNYTVEVRSRLKGLDQIDRVPEELRMDVCDTVQETGIKTIPKKKKPQNKTAVWGGLKNSCEKKRSKKQRRKGKIYPFKCRVPKNSKER